MKKNFLSIFLIILLLLACIPQAYAMMPVFDEMNYFNNQQMYLDQIQNTINSFDLLSNQTKQLENDAKNMIKLNGSLTDNNIQNVQRALMSLINVFQTTRGIILNYEQIQPSWDLLYKDFANYNGMSAANYAYQSKLVRQQTTAAIYDAMRSQGLIAQINDDVGNLNSLLYASKTSEGTLTVLQVTNQLLGMLIQQMMRMQQIMAASYRAESSYYADIVLRENVSQNSSMTLNAPNTLEGEGNGEGFVDF